MKDYLFNSSGVLHFYARLCLKSKVLTVSEYASLSSEAVCTNFLANGLSARSIQPIYSEHMQGCKSHLSGGYWSLSLDCGFPRFAYGPGLFARGIAGVINNRCVSCHVQAPSIIVYHAAAAI